jgi:bacillithiol system protein YtxJ
VNSLSLLISAVLVIAASVAMFKDPGHIFIYVTLAIGFAIVFYRRLRVYLTNKKSAVMQTLRTIENEDALTQALQAENAVLYKHSTRCPISANVYHEVVKFAGKFPEIPVYLIKVIENRDLSNQLSDRLDVTHESPQVFVIKKGRPAWHASHYNISAAKLREQFAS